MRATQILQKSSASRKLPLTTKQASKGYYKGNRVGSMGWHTKHGGYIIDLRKVRTYVTPKTPKDNLTPFVSKNVNPEKPISSANDTFDLGFEEAERLRRLSDSWLGTKLSAKTMIALWKKQYEAGKYRYKEEDENWDEDDENKQATLALETETELLESEATRQSTAKNNAMAQ